MRRHLLFLGQAEPRSGIPEIPKWEELEATAWLALENAKRLDASDPDVAKLYHELLEQLTRERWRQ